MSDERKPWVLAGFRRRFDPERAREFADTARRLQRERVAAADVVEKLLKETPAEDWPALAERGDLQTCGALEKLGNYVAETVNRDPPRALAVAELAVAVAEGISPGKYPNVVVPQLRAHAWKDVGQALAAVGRHAEALAALESAEAEVAGFGALGHDRAIINFVRAKTLQEVDRYDESLALLRECKDVFREHGDQRRLLLCGIAEGVLLHRLCRYREAREAYLLLMAAAPEAIDTDALACLHNVIGHCSVDLDDYAVAETHLSRALDLFTQLGQPARAAKANVGLSRLLMRRGEIDRAISHLQMIRITFTRLGMTEEAGLCGLEIVEALLIRSRNHEAETLARQIILEFTSAALNARAITALGYLQEAISTRRASTSTVIEVREYIVSLRTSPERELVLRS